MFTFCGLLHETKQKEQTLESVQYGLEIILKPQCYGCISVDVNCCPNVTA